MMPAVIYCQSFQGEGYGVLRSGVNVPYSPEFRETSAKESLLTTMAAMRPKDGPHGEVIRLPENPASWSRFAGPNVFRRDLPPAQTLTDVWPATLLIAAGLFLVDVFNRRVAVPWDKFGSAAAYLLRPRATTAVEARPIDRLRSAKRWRQGRKVNATRATN